jgi:hypothetical protein
MPPQSIYRYVEVEIMAKGNKKPAAGTKPADNSGAKK